MRTPQVPLGFRKPTVKTTFSCLIWANTVTVHFFPGISMNFYSYFKEC